MNRKLSVISDIYNSSAIDEFSQNVRIRKCTYYASEILRSSERNIEDPESVIQHTMYIFNTLEMNTDEHFYSIYRCDPSNSNSVCRDWKLSELACIYLSLNGDPTDLQAIARQQTDLIDIMLDFMHNQQDQMMNYA